VLQALRNHARALRGAGLRAHEAALWAGARTVLEREWLAGARARTQLAGLRAQLVRRADAAARALPPPGKENATPRSTDARVWDDFAGAWVARTPAVKGRLARDAVVPAAVFAEEPLNAPADATPVPARRLDKGKGKAPVHTPLRRPAPVLAPAHVAGSPFRSPFSPLRRRGGAHTPLARRLLARTPLAAGEEARRWAAQTPVRPQGRAVPVGDHDDEDEAPPLKRRYSEHTPLRRRAEDALAMGDEDAEDEEEAPPSKRRYSAHTPLRRRADIPLDEDGDEEDEDEDDAPPPKRRYSAHTPLRQRADVPLGEDEDEDEVPPPKRRYSAHTPLRRRAADALLHSNANGAPAQTPMARRLAASFASPASPVIDILPARGRLRPAL
jgi:hypothetical protein